MMIREPPSDQSSAAGTGVAVIVPSLAGQAAPLLASIRRQTLQPADVVVVAGVRPNGRARNAGVQQTGAGLLVFVDDDAVLGHEDVLQRLVAALEADRTIGVAGASKLLPPSADWFQRWVAREVPRIAHPVVSEPLETNPEPANHFYSQVTSTCCAMRRSVFEQAGGFDDTLVRGVDTEFLVRVRRLGYRVVLVPHTWTYHPAPHSLGALLRKQFLYGLGHAQEVRRDASRDRGRVLNSPWKAAAYLAFRTAALVPNAFLPYSYADPSWRLSFRPLKALASYTSALGYVCGWLRSPR